MSKNSKVIFIINKYSGTGYRPEVEGKILKTCDALGLECTLEFTREQGHATTLAKAAAGSGFKMVFAVGGDGTVNEVASGLIHTQVPMGIIPKGSGNGLARHLQIPLNVSKALQLLHSSRIIMMDTFTINNKLSCNVSGIGFDGYVAGLFGKDGRRGLISYGKIVLTEFMRYKEFEYEIRANGSVAHKKSFIVSFANSSQFGNNVRIAPAASVLDHQLDASFVRKMPVWNAFFFMRKMFDGTLEKSNYVDTNKVKEIHLSTQDAIPYHVDGEPAGSATEFDIKLNPASLAVAVPVNAANL